MEKNILIFAIYDMKKLVVAFPVKVEKETLNKQLIKYKSFKDFNTHGSFYQKNDHIAYAMLDIKGSKENNKVVVSNDIESGRGENIYIGLDGFWNYVKKWLYHYRGVPKHYFHLYLKEIEFRFNNRNKDMFLELSKLLVEPLPTI